MPKNRAESCPTQQHARRLKLLAKDVDIRSAVHHGGVIRVKRTPDGAVTISCVRILQRRIQSEVISVTDEEAAAIAALLGPVAA